MYFILAGSTAAEAGTACILFWQSGQICFWQRHGGGETASTTRSTSGQTSTPPFR
jgi:hypothetical protein